MNAGPVESTAPAKPEAGHPQGPGAGAPASAPPAPPGAPPSLPRPPAPPGPAGKATNAGLQGLAGVLTAIVVPVALFAAYTLVLDWMAGGGSLVAPGIWTVLLTSVACYVGATVWASARGWKVYVAALWISVLVQVLLVVTCFVIVISALT